ncbi:hypothetical protein [Methylobacterium sp. J-070]|uniref:hypothetical protein n=1 Tax=Methylobacterium sp. J-070 TaxID=2836650 RepID=UPI001FBBA05F|nr:hypothetical protein [Methylobacterium sp. J-070]MCJ2053695.1 hypothetical protein [Methylobacterium sp. J-070]
MADAHPQGAKGLTTGASMGVSIRVMTYADLEQELGLKPASARQLVRRNGWRRVPGNDGRTRVEVPAEEFERYLKTPIEASVEDEENELDTPVETPFEAPLVAALSAHIARLERALDEAEAALKAVIGERDEVQALTAAAREEAIAARGQIDVLRVRLDAERERGLAAAARIEEIAADRDRWHEITTRTQKPWWRRLAG